MNTPIQIDVRTPDTVTIDVSNKMVKVSKQDIKQVLDEFIILDHPIEGDVLLHDGIAFKNCPKQGLTDGGNF